MSKTKTMTFRGGPLSGEREEVFLLPDGSLPKEAGVGHDTPVHFYDLVPLLDESGNDTGAQIYVYRHSPSPSPARA